MSKKRAYIRKRRSVHLRCRQKAENARKVRSRQKPVQSPESASVTFQAAATLWHRTNVARYKGATAVKYENLLRSHILPELGARQLEEINTLLLADFMNAKLHCGRLDHSGGLSSSYVRSMMLLVLDIMEFAAAEGLCPPVKTTLQTPAANRREVVILDTDALRRLETYLLAKPDITGTGILISLHTGLRISEVCALRWEDIDFRKAVLHVRSTVARVRGTDGGTATRLIIDTPKTKSSLRDIPLSRQLMAVLLPLYEKRRSEYVISDKSGFVSPRTYEYRFHRVLDRCGLPSINYHALRHNIEYDKNAADSGTFFRESRRATITVKEHNFDASRVNITLRATDDGADIALPTVSGWTSSGDRHTATIAYRRDGLYTFDIDVTDKAGNTSADFTEQTFYVDTTAPTLEITGVADRSANNGDIIPVVSYSDTNYDDAQVNITLTGAMRKGVALDGSYADQHNGKVFTFKNFAKEKEVDDIYTLAATLTDKAGNTTEKTILFSANRFGSTYALSAATEQLNGSYVQTPQDVVVTETNPDALQNIRITLFKNNQTIILQEGTDYRIEVRGGNGQWYEYIYTVLAKNFADDGVYRLTFYSEDAAGNIAENTLDTKKQEIGFGVDKTKPDMVVTNLESDTTYPLENLTVSLSAGDNLLLQSVVVYLDDYSKAYKTWTAEEVATIVADQGEFTFDIPGDSTGAHQVKIVCTDAAGNEQTEEITNFYVTTNLFVRYYNNKPLFFGSIAAVVVIAGVVIALAAGKKKKNDKEK